MMTTDPNTPTKSKSLPVMIGGLVLWIVSMALGTWSCTAQQARQGSQALGAIAPVVPGVPGAVLEDSLNLLTWRLEQVERNHAQLAEKTGEPLRLGWQDWLTILGVSSGASAATGGGLAARISRKNGSANEGAT